MAFFPRTLISLCLVSASISSAKVVGTNPEPQPLTEQRIAALPENQQGPWRSYLERSKKALQADQAFLAGELQAAGLKEAIPAPKGGNAALTQSKPAAWYASAEALTMAERVISYQTPSGGWSKNLSVTQQVRPPGGSFSGEVMSRKLSADDNDAGLMNGWSYIGTFDNGATTTQLGFLAKVASALDPEAGAAVRAAVVKGLQYVFNAQYPNGGFPQVWPLMGGYHDSITFNDDAMIRVIGFLDAVAEGQAEYAWLPADLRDTARKRSERALACVLACQTRVNGQRRAWSQQNDMLTLAPAPARNYEMPAFCSGESASIVLYLMRRTNPTPEIVAAVHGAAAWFEQTKIKDMTFDRREGSDGRVLSPAPGSGNVLWARFYDVVNNRPLYGDRDKTIHDDVNEISRERRNNYSWLSTSGNRVLDHYRKWSKQHPMSAK